MLPNVAVALLGQGGAIARDFLAVGDTLPLFRSYLLTQSAVHGHHVDLLVQVDRRVVHCQLQHLQDVHQPPGDGQAADVRQLIGMVCFTLFMAAFATGLYYIGISMGYLYVLMGVIISSAVLPASLTLLWADQSWASATFAPILGFISSVTAWLVHTKKAWPSRPRSPAG